MSHKLKTENLVQAFQNVLQILLRLANSYSFLEPSLNSAVVLKEGKSEAST